MAATPSHPHRRSSRLAVLVGAAALGSLVPALVTVLDAMSVRARLRDGVLVSGRRRRKLGRVAPPRPF